MPLRIEVRTGEAAGTTFHTEDEVTVLGRDACSGLMLPDRLLSKQHVRLLDVPDGFFVEDLGSTNGTFLFRDNQWRRLDPNAAPTALSEGDLVSLGADDDDGVVLELHLAHLGGNDRVLRAQPIQKLAATTQSPERNAIILARLSRAQERLGKATSLLDVATGIADAALEILDRATHATVVLRETGSSEEERALLFRSAVSRCRGADGALVSAPLGALPRTLFRRVVEEKVATLSADALEERYRSESLLGAHVRSTMAIPLWHGEVVVGALQVDNRDRPAMFDNTDLDTLGILAAHASLALANAQLIARLREAEERLSRENTYLRRRESARSEEKRMVGESNAMRTLNEQIDKVAGTRVSVLIEGETGSGKELVALALHHRSDRRKSLFIAQNCAALPESLLESELFGHRKGAFTGATEEKRGLFELADGGTLFLDEVTEMALPLQAKLLRVLQEGEVRPVGSTVVKRVNVRIVAATNRNLETEVAQGRFREDLYYRLKVFPLRVPPLRERREDIPQLANHFFARYREEFGKDVGELQPDALLLLQAYEWPGNVRELENEVQRLVIQAEWGEPIGAALVSRRLQQEQTLVDAAAGNEGTLRDRIERVEKHLLLEALEQHGQNKSATARALGITREGLHKKLKQLGIG